MPPPRALKRSSWEKRASGLFFNLAAEHVYTTSPCPVTLWGRGKHDPSRHLSPDRRTRMGRRKISTMPPITLKVRRNRTDKSSWKFCQVSIFIDKNNVKFWLVSSFANAAAKLHMNHRLRYKNIAYKAGEFGRWWKTLGEFILSRAAAKKKN